MKKLILIIFFGLLALISTSKDYDSLINKLVEQQTTKSKNIEDKLEKYQNKLYDETIRKYQETNDRINTHISYLSMIATVFGSIIAIGGILIGFESIRSNRKRDEAIKTLEEAKTYVITRKEEFEGELTGVKENLEEEFKKIVGLFKDQLVKEIDSETSKIKDLTTKKTEEIESYSVQQENDEIIENLSKRIKFFESVGIPDDPKILLSKAKLLGEKEMHQDAIEVLEKIVSLENTNKDAYWRLGWEYSKLNKPDISIVNYLKSIELDPTNSTAYNNLAVEYEKINKYYDALKNYEKAIEFSPKRKLYYVNKAKVLKKLGSQSDALEVYEKSIELFSDDFEVYQYLIAEYKAQNMNDKVIDTYDLAIERFPDRSQPLNGQKAAFLFGINKYPEAIVILNSLIEIGFHVETCSTILAEIYEKQNEIDKAIETIEKTIQLNKLNVSLVAKKIGLLFIKNKDLAFEYIVKSGTEINSEKVFEIGGKLFAKDRNYDKANDLYSRALRIIELKLANNNEIDIVNYYEVLIILGEYEKADAFILGKQEFVQSLEYKKVLDFLLFIKKILNNEITITRENLIEFKKDDDNIKGTWNYYDILYKVMEKLDSKAYECLESLSNYIKNVTSKEEFEKVINGKFQ